MKLGFLYAGQGSQHPGMGADLYEAYPTFRAVFDAATLDFDLKERCFTDSAALLNQTRYTQPCMAAFRGKVMEASAAGVESAMMAVLGLEREKLQAACTQASDAGTVVIANYNCPGQLVIGGEKAAVERAAVLAKEAGARRCMPLKVSGPFHTPLMESAGRALEEYFRSIVFHNPDIPVVFNCLGSVKTEGDSIPELLVRQVQSSVYMEDSIRAMVGLGVETLVEIGPGKVLSGFARKTAPETPIFAVETAEDVEKLLVSLEQLEKERGS